MSVLVITNATAGKLNENVLSVLTAAMQINRQISVLVIGEVADLSILQSCSSVNKILQLTINHEHNLATFIAPAIAKLIPGYSHVLVAADSYGKDLLPRIAGILDLSQISEVMGIVSPNIFKRPMYAGNIIAEVESFEAIKLLTIRPTCFAPMPVGEQQDIAIERLAPVTADTSTLAWQTEEIIASETIDLATARIVVSGGHSLGSKQDFETIVHGLATKLGAAVGASRAAVEAGFAANDCQVGQTGKIVAPDLYIAIGISGAVQHIAGIKGAKTVIAINIDPHAQIFDYADYGLVGDLFTIVPQLIQQL